MNKRLATTLVLAGALLAGGCAVYPVGPMHPRGVVVAPAPVYVGPPAVTVYGGYGYRPYHRPYHRHHHHHW